MQKDIDENDGHEHGDEIERIDAQKAPGKEAIDFRKRTRAEQRAHELSAEQKPREHEEHIDAPNAEKAQANRAPEHGVRDQEQVVEHHERDREGA